MAHTDRDDARWFWHNHLCGDDHDPHNWYMGWGCWCETLPGARGWIAPYRYEQAVPSEWNRDCRREERARARSLIQRARAGHIDWDDLVINYRRPYYW